MLVLYELTVNGSRLMVNRVRIHELLTINYKRILPYFMGLGFYLVWRFFILDLGARGEYLVGSFYKTALVMTQAMVKYLWLLIWPVNLSIDHQILPGIYAVIYKAFVSTKTLESLSILTPGILVNLAILIGLAVGAVVCWKRWRIISFAVGWFFITLLPVAFILPQSAVMSERYVYLASFGFVLAVSYFSYLGYLRFLSWRGIMLVIFVAFVVGYAARTYARNLDWKDTLTVWEKLAKQAPNNPVTNYTLAKIYAEKGNIDSAIFYFEKALGWGEIPEVNYRLGKIYFGQGKLGLAEAYFAKALDENTPRYYFAARRELAKIEYVKSQSQSEESKSQSDKWVKYNLEKRVTFEYPESWMVTKFEKGVAFDALDVSFSVEIFVDGKDRKESFESYLARQPDHFGKLVGKGPARVPNVEEAYVKVFKDDEVDKLEFFLSQNEVVLKILVYPANSPKMQEFDKLLGSIRIDAD